MIPYPSSVEKKMKKFFDSLSEKDKRRYAAIETLKLGHGGRKYISQILGCNRKTIRRGIQELKDLPENISYTEQIRGPGAGRKQYDNIPCIDEKFLDVLRENTAGNPMDEKVLWTNLTQQEISEKLAEKYQIYVSTQIVRKLLKKHNYRRRKAQKKQTMKTAKNRNEQFENIARIKSEYETSCNPIISMDTKKKRTLATIIGMVTCILKK